MGGQGRQIGLAGYIIILIYAPVNTFLIGCQGAHTFLTGCQGAQKCSSVHSHAYVYHTSEWMSSSSSPWHIKLCKMEALCHSIEGGQFVGPQPSISSQLSQSRACGASSVTSNVSLMTTSTYMHHWSFLYCFFSPFMLLSPLI